MAERFLDGGGATGSLLRTVDWSGTPLGPSASWPASLKTVVGLMLAANQPMFVVWGPQRTLLYNQDYSHILANRHPAALGRPFFDVWPEVADEIGPIVDRAYRGEPTAMDDIQLKVFRRGYEEEAHFSFFYAPVRGDDGDIAGMFCACSDITDQVLARRRVEATSARHRRLFDIAPGFVAVLKGPELVFEFANQSFTRLFGGNELVGLRLAECASVTLGPELLGAIDKVRSSGGRRLCHELPFQSENAAGKAEEIRLNFVVEALTDELGLVEGVFVQGADCTAAFRAKEDLRRSGDRFRLAVGSIGVVWTATSDGRMRGEQPGWTQLTGQAVDEYADFGWAQVIHPEEAQATIDAWRAAVSKQQTFEFEHRIRSGEGWRTFAVRAIPVLDGQGRVQEWVGVHIDITEQREAQRQLTELNRSLEARVAERTAERDTMWQLSEDILLVLTGEGIVKAASPSVEPVLGVRPADLIGKPARDWQHPDDAKDSQRLQTEVLERPVRIVNRMRAASGDFRQVSWRAVASEGTVYAVGRDVTDDIKAAAALESAEAALRQSQKMEAVGNLTGGIAHDFNNLLQGISTALQLISRRADDQEQVRKWAERSLESVRRGAKLTSQLLTFSRLQALRLEAVDVSTLLENMSDMLARTVGPSLHFVFDTAGTRGLLAMADATQLELAIVNLCINARDAMPEGGEVTIATRSRDDAWIGTGLPEGAYLQISVIDSGEGMSPEVAKRAFDPFFTTKGVGRGTGLGLSQVYGFTHQAGGRALIESRMGQGTTVSLLLRQVERILEPDAPQVDTVPRSKDAELLIVDDDVSVRELMAELLGSLGYKVRVADDGPSCLQALAAGLPDLLITDFAMPGMNGAQLALRARQRYPELPIVFLTGYSDSNELQHAVGASNTVLKKPVQTTALVAAIEREIRVIRKQ